MKITMINDEHWHELRAKHIGGSEVACLFGRSKYHTPWQLWQIKAGNLDMPFDDKFTKAGVHFESGIAAWAAEKWGMTIHKVKDYYRDDQVPGMGATLDYADDAGIPVEIKFNHFATEEWKFEGGELVELPEQYVWQVQHQMACYGGDHAWVVAFVKGDVHRLLVRRSETIIKAIRRKIAAFWESIEKNQPPPVDFTEDGDALKQLLLHRNIFDVQLEGYEGLFSDYAAAYQRAKDAEKEADALKAQLLSLAEKQMHGVNEVVDKAVVSCGKFRMTLSRIAANEGKLVTQDMVGTRINAKREHMRVDIREKKEK